MQTTGQYQDYLELFLFFGLLAIAFNCIALFRGFFTLYPRSSSEKNVLKFSSVATVFGIYLAMTMLISQVFVEAVKKLYAAKQIPPPMASMGWVQLIVISLTLFLFYLYAKTLDRSLIGKILKDRSLINSSSIGRDFFIGILTWIISFPLVIAIGQLTDLLLYLFAGFESYEQVAVRYLKTALSSPPTLAIALFTILVAAPAIEEFLFRGFLQTYFKRYMPVRWAIVLSSLCFALFHYAPSQGIGNISLVVSLFSFALYLGFIYERQGSLFASLGLHMTFNAVSTFRILFFPDS